LLEQRRGKVIAPGANVHGLADALTCNVIDVVDVDGIEAELIIRVRVLEVDVPVLNRPALRDRDREVRARPRRREESGRCRARPRPARCCTGTA
jgi:hypothetical protein